MTDTSWTSTSSMFYDGPSNWSNGVPIVTNNGIFGIGPPNPIKTVVVSGGTDHAGGWIFNGGAYTIDISLTFFFFYGVGVQVTAGSAQIEVQPLSILTFNNGSSAGNATIEVQSNGNLHFNNNSDGGAAPKSC